MKELNPIQDTPLTEKQKRFAQYYSGIIGSCYGNATQSYLQTYGCSKGSAEASGARMLGNVRVCEYITRLHGERLNTEAVDAELAYVVFQREDLPSKMRAITEYNKIQGRIKKSDSGMDPVLHEFYMGIVDSIEKNRLKELPQEIERVVIEQ